MTDPKLCAKLAQIMAKAERALLAARNMVVRDKSPDFAVSRAYYAVFYAMEAALLSQGKTFSKHQGVIAAFSKDFVRTGTFPSHFGASVGRLFRDRQMGDYRFDASIAEEHAEQDIAIAEEIVHAVRQHLADSSFL